MNDTHLVDQHGMVSHNRLMVLRNMHQLAQEQYYEQKVDEKSISVAAVVAALEGIVVETGVGVGDKGPCTGYHHRSDQIL